MAKNTKKFMSKITFSSKTRDINNGKKISSHEPYFVLEIPQEILMHWHDLKAKGREARKYANFIAKEHVLPFRIVGNAAFEKRVNDAACLALRDCRGKSGRKKKALLQKTRSIKVCEDDVEDMKSVADLETKCSDLNAELVKVKAKAKVVEDKLNVSIEEKSMLENQNFVLTKQLGDTGKPACSHCINTLENTSRKLDQVGTRQRQRKVTNVVPNMY